MNTFDVSHQITDFFGEPIMEEDKPLTYGKVIVLSLMANFQEDSKLPVEEKLQRFTMAQNVATALLKGQDVSLDSVEVDIIKRCANRALTVYSFGKLNQFLNGG